MFQLIAWGHVAVLSQHHSGETLVTVAALDQIHMVFALLPWIEVPTATTPGYHTLCNDYVVKVFLLLKRRGFAAYFLQQGASAEAMYSWGTLLCLCVALCGVELNFLPAEGVYINASLFGRW